MYKEFDLGAESLFSLINYCFFDVPVTAAVVFACAP